MKTQRFNNPGLTFGLLHSRILRKLRAVLWSPFQSVT